MVFATESQKQEATAMVIDGIKAKAIAEKLGVDVTMIYQLKFELKKAGKIKGKAKTAQNAGAKKNQSKKTKKTADDFDIALANEIKRIEDEIERLNGMMNVQDKVSPSFAVALETKIQRNTETLTALREFQN
jgi:transposase